MRKFDLRGKVSPVQWAVEGSDGSGKGTLTTNLVNVLRNEMGLRVARLSFPMYDDTVGGGLLDVVLKSSQAASFNFSKLDPYAASLLYAMDRREALPELKRIISNRDVVIYDRFVDSNLLHQGGKFKTSEERLKFARWLYELEYEELELPRPKGTLYLKLPWEISLRRIKERAEREDGSLDLVEQDLEYMRNSHEAGIFYAEQLKWEVIDCMEGGTETSQQRMVSIARSITGLLSPDYIDSIP